MRLQKLLWLAQANGITLKTQVHAVNACRKRVSQRALNNVIFSRPQKENGQTRKRSKPNLLSVRSNAVLSSDWIKILLQFGYFESIRKNDVLLLLL